MGRRNCCATVASVTRIQPTVANAMVETVSVIPYTTIVAAALRANTTAVAPVATRGTMHHNNTSIANVSMYEMQLPGVEHSGQQCH